MATQQAQKGNGKAAATKQTPPPEDDDFFDGGGDGGDDDGGGGGDDEILDLSDVDENAGFELVPAGVHDAIVADAEFGESQRSGKKMITWTFELTGSNEKVAGKTLKYYTVTETANGMARLKKMLVRIAPNLNMKTFRPGVTPQELIGNACRLKIQTRRYQGENRNDVKDVLPPAASKVFSED